MALSQNVLVNSLDQAIAALADGAGNLLISSTSAPVGSEQALIVRNIPSGTQAVSGPLTDAELRATPVPISGTVTANLGTIAGVSTAANQLAVQGSASGGTAAASSELVGGIYNSSAPSLTNGQQASLQLDASGNLKVANNIPSSATSTLSNVASSASSVSLLASNANRKGFMIYNDSTKKVYVKFGATASATSFTVIIQPDGFYEHGDTIYTGAIDAIWSAANGFARVTELT